jgi:glycosyltransferase involved in cell wall biosynthesis
MRILIASTESWLPLFKSFEFHLNEVGVETKIIDIREYFSIHNSAVLNGVPFPKVAKVMKSFEPDVVLTGDPIFTSLFKRVIKRPLILWLRGDPWQEMDWRWRRYEVRPDPLSRFRWQFFDERYFWGIKKVDAIFAVCDWLREKVRRLVGNVETKTLRYIGDLRGWTEEPPKTSEPRIQVLSVFEFEIIPKLLGWLRFLKVAKDMNDTSFYVAGGGPYLDRVKSKSPRNILYLGQVPHETVKKLLLDSSVFVHPSGLDMAARTVVEASLMSLPVIVSDICGLPEMVENGKSGFVCSLNNERLWEEKIQTLLANPNLRARLGSEGRKRILDMFEPRTVVKEFVSQIDSSLLRKQFGR